MKRPKLMIVEDEWLLAMMTQSAAREAGCDVLAPAPTVERGLALLTGEQVDAAVLDIALDGETSYPVADRLVALDMPFLFLTGYTRRDLPDRFASRPLIEKPALQAALVAAIKRLLQ